MQFKQILFFTINGDYLIHVLLNANLKEKKTFAILDMKHPNIFTVHIQVHVYSH